MTLKVIISGAGIGGLALAYWLDRIGASTVIVEHAPRFQALGHYISLKGNGVEMVRRMGIFDACQARAAPVQETRMYTMKGRLLGARRTAALDEMLGGYILFRRADLQAALYDLARERAEITRGRCALLGDAAHCPTFMSGMGSSLALQGANILAGCLARTPGDIAAALARYEEMVDPIARRYRGTALKMRGPALGRSRFKAHLRDLALRMVPERLVAREMRRFFDTERPLAEVPGFATAGGSSNAAS